MNPWAKLKISEQWMVTQNFEGVEVSASGGGVQSRLLFCGQSLSLITGTSCYLFCQNRAMKKDEEAETNLIYIPLCLTLSVYRRAKMKRKTTNSRELLVSLLCSEWGWWEEARVPGTAHTTCKPHTEHFGSEPKPNAVLNEPTAQHHCYTMETQLHGLSERNGHVSEITQIYILFLFIFDDSFLKLHHLKILQKSKLKMLHRVPSLEIGTGSLCGASCWWFPGAVQQLVEVDSLGAPLRLLKLRIETFISSSAALLLSFVGSAVRRFSLSLVRWAGEKVLWVARQTGHSDNRPVNQLPDTLGRCKVQSMTESFSLHSYWLLGAAAANNFPSEMWIKMHFFNEAKHVWHLARAY